MSPQAIRNKNHGSVLKGYIAERKKGKLLFYLIERERERMYGMIRE